MALDSLSALLDGECSKDELDRVLAELEQSPELARQWSRLCLSRDVREGVRLRSAGTCICDDVMSRLDTAPAPADATVIDLAARQATRQVTRQAGRPSALQTLRNPVWKPLVGFAAAASMGAAAVFLLQPQANPIDPDRQMGIPAAGTLAHWQSAPASAVQAVVLSEDQAHADELRQYLMDHSSAVAGEGLGGTLRYARFAAHTADSRPEPDAQR